MENKKPKTIDEFFIEKYNKLEEEIEVLKKEQEELLEMNYNLGEERDKWEQKYYELIGRLKEDFVPIIKKASCDDKYFKLSEIYIWKENEEVKFEYYKNLFNLKEEGEEDNEQ